VLGYHGVAGNIGIAVAPAIALAFASTVGWRWAYVFLALLALIMVFLIRMLALPQAPDLPKSSRSASPVKTPQIPVLPLLLIFGAFLLNGFIYRGSMTFLPTLIEEEVHISLLGINEAALAGSLTTLALLAGAAGQLLGGSLSDRVEMERLAPLIAVTLVPALLLMGLTGGLLLVAASAFFVFFNFSSQPVYNSLLAEYVPGSAIGRSYGLSFFASFGLGSTAATFSGFLAERWGTPSVFLALAVFAGLALLLATLLWRLAQGLRLREVALVDTMELR
jgi:predicted MFS family arabinose efflux permease